MDFPKIEVVEKWRAAYKKFKNPDRNRCSIEALLKRVSKGNAIRNINPLVDLYNIISLKYFVPVGAEDIDKIDGEVQLAVANGSENFTTLGADEVTHPVQGEVVYKFQDEVICRCFNWRESDKTKITEDTKNAMVVLEFLNENQETIEKSMNFLKNLIEEKLDGNCEDQILLSSENRCFTLGN